MDNNEIWVLEYSELQQAYHIETKASYIKRGQGPGHYRIIFEGTQGQVRDRFAELVEREIANGST